MQQVETAAGSRWRLTALFAGALALIALAIPALASAHPAVYELTPKALPSSEPAKSECNYGLSPTGSCLVAGAKRYAIANDGYAMTFTESAESGTAGGALNYQMMPGTFRKWTGGEMTSEQKRTFGPAQTTVQAHATCEGVSALASGSNILAWQGNDPFFNYIPWQKTSAGLGDEPSKWIPVVKTAVSVDLDALNSEDEFKAACQGKGGTYRKADTPSNPATAAVAAAVAAATAPLQDEVAALLGEKSTLQGQVDQWKASSAALEIEKGTLASERTALASEKAALEQRVNGLKKANKNKNKTIKKLRKQLKAARNG